MGELQQAVEPSWHRQSQELAELRAIVEAGTLPPPVLQAPQISPLLEERLKRLEEKTGAQVSQFGEELRQTQQQSIMNLQNQHSAVEPMLQRQSQELAELRAIVEAGTFATLGSQVSTVLEDRIQRLEDNATMQVTQLGEELRQSNTEFTLILARLEEAEQEVCSTLEQSAGTTSRLESVEEKSHDLEVSMGTLNATLIAIITRLSSLEEQVSPRQSRIERHGSESGRSSGRLPLSEGHLLSERLKTEKCTSREGCLSEKSLFVLSDSGALHNSDCSRLSARIDEQVALIDTINVRLTSCENYQSESELDGKFEDQRRWCAEKLAALIACIEDERRSRSSDESVICERIDMVERRLDLPRQHDQGMLHERVSLPSLESETGALLSTVEALHQHLIEEEARVSSCLEEGRVQREELLARMTRMEDKELPISEGTLAQMDQGQANNSELNAALLARLEMIEKRRVEDSETLPRRVLEIVRGTEENHRVRHVFVERADQPGRQGDDEDVCRQETFMSRLEELCRLSTESAALVARHEEEHIQHQSAIGALRSRLKTIERINSCEPPWEFAHEELDNSILERKASSVALLSRMKAVEAQKSQDATSTACRRGSAP